MSNTTDGKSSVNCKRLTMFKQLTDTASGTTYASEAYTFNNELNSVKYTPKVATASQYGDGVKVEDHVAKDGGTLDVVIRGYKPGDSVFLFGETDDNGTEVSNAGDIVPYVLVAYHTVRADGKYNLYKYPKVKWMPQGENANQQEGSTVNYGTASLQGTYSPLLSNGDDKYTKYGVDPKNDAEFIEKWFTEAAFYQQTEQP